MSLRLKNKNSPALALLFFFSPDVLSILLPLYLRCSSLNVPEASRFLQTLHLIPFSRSVGHQ